MDPIEQGVWKAMLETAILAPSPHNVQPWRLRIESAEAADLFIEKRRTLPREDETGSFIILTMGLFVETLRLVAADRGLALVDELVHEPGWYAAEHLESIHDPILPFARLRLHRDESARAEYPPALLLERRTSRLPYRPEPVNEEATQSLADLARDWNMRYEAVQDPGRIERMLGWNIDAVFEDLNRPPYRDEMRGWLRYTRGQSERHRDGLDSRCMHTAPLDLWMAFHLGALLRWPPTRAWLRRRYRAQIGPVATLGMIAGPFWDPSEAYDAGRFLIRFWLECTRLGYSIHPYGNLVTNSSAAARIEAETGTPRIWLVFKIGRSDPPPRSLRRTVEEVLLA